jgi:hypothetical protein
MKPNSTATVRSQFGAAPAPILAQAPADRALDREIIAALVAEEGDGLSALFRRGFSEQAVTERAALLGLTRDFIKRCRLAGTQPALRSCVRCDVPFLSAGPHNRLCGRCPLR